MLQQQLQQNMTMHFLIILSMTALVAAIPLATGPARAVATSTAADQSAEPAQWTYYGDYTKLEYGNYEHYPGVDE